MLDVNDFIKERGGDPDRIKLSQRRRNEPEEVVDLIISLYDNARRRRYEASQIGQKINEVQKEIRVKKKAQEDAQDSLQLKLSLETEKRELEEQASKAESDLDKQVRMVGNYVHDSVPIGTDEALNEIIRKWSPNGTKFTKQEVLSHHHVLLKINGYDPERGVKIAGHRGYCLTDYGLFLNMALINYGLEFLWSRGYQPRQPPHFMLREYMSKTAQLTEFDESLYALSDAGDAGSGEKYMIATSEQPLSAMHAGEWIQSKDLPIKYAGYSSCYRKEAGAHGKDAWGIFRVHQFEKIEQFLITSPHESWEAFESMMTTSELFYQSLGLPYQIVSIVSGALNNAASKKYDLEAWFPHQGEFKELVSCTNCTDYQSRALEVRYGVKKAQGKDDNQRNTKEYVHMLNSTLCATERTLCCILENYQTESGLRVPEVLRRYIPGNPDFIPFAKEEKTISIR